MLLHARRSPRHYPFAMAMLLLAFAFVGTPRCISLAAAAQQGHLQSTAFFEQATAALRAGDLKTAADEFEQATKLAPTFAEGFLNLGLVREEQGEHDAAVIALERAITLKPGLRGANLFLGIAEYRLDHFDKAAAALKRETKLNPADPHAWMWLGVDDLAAKHLEEAVDALDKAAKLSPDDVDILYHRGHALLLLSRESYEHMFAVDPKSWRVHEVLAQGFAESDRDLDAIAEYRLAVAAAPKEPGLHASLATELWKSGQMTEATREYRDELAVDPFDTLARYQLGCLLIEESGAGTGSGTGAEAGGAGGTVAEGRELLEKALRYDPTLPNGYYYLGRASMKLGEDQKAIEQFQQMLAGRPSEAYEEQTYYQLARLYRRVHQPDNAAAALARFKQLQAADHEKTLDTVHQRIQSQADAVTPLPKSRAGDPADQN